MLLKTRVRLEPGYPVFLVDQTKKNPDLKFSLELVEFEAKNGRIAWTVKLGTGQHISGFVKEQHPLPFLPNSWIALAIPVCLNLRPSNRFAPDFIVCAPGSYAVVADLKKIR